VNDGSSTTIIEILRQKAKTKTHQKTKTKINKQTKSHTIQ
jgi:hypothetical protein